MRDSGFYQRYILVLFSLKYVYWGERGGKGNTNLRFAARAALLCLHKSGEARKRTQRMGTLSSLARAVQCARVSGSAFVLSVFVSGFCQIHLVQMHRL